MLLIFSFNFCNIDSIQGFRFGIEVVKNSEWACVFCIAVIVGGFAPHIGTMQNTQATSEFLTTSIPKQKPLDAFNFCDNEKYKIKSI